MGKVLVISGGNFAAHRVDQIDIDTSVYYSVTANLVGYTISPYNPSVKEETSFSATLTKDIVAETETVVITMGGTNITSTAFNSSTGAISIAEVTGNIVINATATSSWTAHHLTQGGINVVKSQTNKFGKKVDSVAQSYGSRISSDIAESIFVKSGQVLHLSGVENLYLELIAYSSSDTIDTESQNPDTPSAAITTYAVEHGFTSSYFMCPRGLSEDSYMWENTLGYDCYIRISACTNKTAAAESVSPRTIQYKVVDVSAMSSGTMSKKLTGINITTNNSGYLKGRLIDYQDSNYGKRLCAFGDGYYPIIVPSGASVTITGLLGLLTECVRYKELHSVKGFGLTSYGSPSSQGYNYSVLGTITSVNPMFEDNSGGDSSSDWFTLTDGTQNSLTLTNSTNGTLYYAFLFKTTSDGTLDPDDYSLAFEVESAS